MDDSALSPRAAVRIEDFRLAYPDGRIALDCVSLEVSSGDSFAVLGANGAGKSTLLLAMVGILRGTGSVTINEIRLCDANLADIRRAAQLVFQEPDDQLFSPTIRDDVAFGPINFGRSKDEIDGLVEHALANVGLEGFEARRPHNLSLGERKRAALAAVLACEPEFLLLDEPTAGLDPRAKRELITLLNGLSATKLIATHDIDFARQVCRMAAVMVQGQIVDIRDIESLAEDEPALRSWGLQ